MRGRRICAVGSCLAVGAGGGGACSPVGDGVFECLEELELLPLSRAEGWVSLTHGGSSRLSWELALWPRYG
jgi:hypothetical protein